MAGFSIIELSADANEWRRMLDEEFCVSKVHEKRRKEKTIQADRAPKQVSRLP